MPTPIWTPFHQAIHEGRHALLLVGRDLRDLDVYEDESHVGPILEILRQELLSQHDMLLLTYSRAEGILFDDLEITKSDVKLIQEVLRTHGLNQAPEDGQEMIQIARSIASFCRTLPQGMEWSNGQPLRFCLLLEFGQHLFPFSSYDVPTEEHIIASEFIHITAQSLAFRKTQNLLLIHTPDSALVDPLVRDTLHQIRLPQPDQEEKLRFVNAISAHYPKASLEIDLTWEISAFLSSNTPNRGLENLVRASHRNGIPIGARDLVAQKIQDVQSISEQTLTVLDTSNIARQSSLLGINSAYPQSILQNLAKGLATGDPFIPANVLLVGPPGTGKTEMSLITAKCAGVAAYQMHSPKTGLVGETERKAELQQRVLREWIPNLAFVDEITEALPLERSDHDGDSGASRAVGAALLTALADESRRGRSLLIATTNCPWRMGAAMRSRFVGIPVLQPLPQDYPSILLAIVERVAPDLHLQESDEMVQEAAALFVRKRANPRHIRAALTNARLLRGILNAESLVFAASDLSMNTDTISAIYSDLWAVKVCTAWSFFPWSKSVRTYPFPEHLQGIVDTEAQEIDTSELDQRIERYRPYANL